MAATLAILNIGAFIATIYYAVKHVKENVSTPFDRNFIH